MTTTELTGTRVTGGRVLAAGWRVFIPTVVVLALAQSLLATLAEPVVASTAFAIVSAVSATLAAVALWLTTVTAVRHASGSRSRRLRALIAVLVLFVLLGAVAIFAAVLIPLVILAGVVVLPAVAARTSGSVRRHPVRWIAFAVVVLLVVGLSWVVALVLGFFVTGPVADGVTWLWFGACGTVLLAHSAALRFRGAS